MKLLCLYFIVKLLAQANIYKNLFIMYDVSRKLVHYKFIIYPRFLNGRLFFFKKKRSYSLSLTF